MGLFKKIKLKYYGWKIKEGMRMLGNFDSLMTKAGLSRQDRRAMWREVAKSSENRNKVIDRIVKETG